MPHDHGAILRESFISLLEEIGGQTCFVPPPVSSGMDSAWIDLPISEDSLDVFGRICARENVSAAMEALLLCGQADLLEFHGRDEDIPDLGWISIESVLADPEKARNAVWETDGMLGNPLEAELPDYGCFRLEIKAVPKGGKLVLSMTADFSAEPGMDKAGLVKLAEICVDIPETRKEARDAVKLLAAPVFPKLFPEAGNQPKP